MNRLPLLAALMSAGFTLSAVAQNVPPVVSSQIANFTEYAGAPARSIDLAPAFSDPDVSNAVRMTTVLGNIDLALFGQQKPITVTNFLKYVDQGRYFVTDPTTNQIASSFIHRSVPGFIVQGGGYIGTVDPNLMNNPNKDNVQPTQVLAFAPIQNEPGISNKRGTIAMAQTTGNPNSATSQWFINLADNGGPPNNLDVQTINNGVTAGPYTVFGRVVGNGMTVADSIAAVPRYNFSAPFNELPLRNYNTANPVKLTNLVSLPGIAQISPLSFSAMSDTAKVSVTVSGTKLLVTGNNVGTAHVTVTATDFDGGTVSQMFTVNVIAAPGRPVNLSTRMQVGTGDNALIAGFIMRGAASKRLAVRGMGPSTGLPGAIVNPTLELHDSSNATIASNDDWESNANKQDIIDIGLAPNSPTESVILTTVPSDTNGVAYTAVMRGANNTTGLGVVEVYDLDSGPGSTLLNISTRGQVGTDPNALIGGFILGGTESKNILVRAIGPSLTAFGVPNALSDPTLELHDGNGALIDSNDDWMNSPQKTDIQNSGLAPGNAKESAILHLLPSGAYTAIVRGTNSGTGIGSVEVYQLP
ncbi:MAG TPA: peptidylprolyl isomerase [Chthoniobacterales bacterium]|nr:peptidylprolyl isomerase [Chthoniobacterales bacterium]